MYYLDRTMITLKDFIFVTLFIRIKSQSMQCNVCMFRSDVHQFANV